MDATGPLRPHLTLLGEFGVHFGDESLKVTRPAQRLLTQLAVRHRDRPVRRSSLAERLWPDSDPERAGASLRSVVWRLPRPRGRVLVLGDASTLRLAPEVRVDLWEAERLAGALRAAADEPGATDPADQHPDADLTLLEHDLVPDDPDDWVSLAREGHRQVRLHGLERAAVSLCARGCYERALAAGHAAVSAEPLRETAHRCVIGVHLAEGNAAEALRQYERYRRLLASELGICPTPAIRRMVAPLLGRPVDHLRPA